MLVTVALVGVVTVIVLVLVAVGPAFEGCAVTVPAASRS
jgi:hypothetical protein